MSSDFARRCDGCHGPLEAGSVLISSLIYWSNRPRLPLLPDVVFAVAIRGTYSGRATQLPAGRCERCRRCDVLFDPDCAHTLEEGWLFPQAAVRWSEGDQAFEPAFLWPFVTRSRTGRTSEPVIPGGLRLSASRLRVKGWRCRECRGFRIAYSRASAASAGV